MNIQIMLAKSEIAVALWQEFMELTFTHTFIADISDEGEGQMK
jgi:hypothetical protein